MEITKVVTFIIGVSAFVTMFTPSKVFAGTFLCRNVNDTQVCEYIEDNWKGIMCNNGYKLNIRTEKCVPIRSSLTGTEGKHCLDSEECLSSLLCSGQLCDNPCKDDPMAIPDADCVIQHHKMKYVCRPGYEHPSYSDEYCYRIPGTECEKNFNCQSSMICNFGRCINPCKEWPGPNADCTVENHRSSYQCHAGYQKLRQTNICVPTGSQAFFED